MNREKILSILAKFYNQKRKIDNLAMCRILTNLYLSLNKAESVLDLGSGSGRMLLPLAHLYPQITFEAADDSDLMLTELEKQVEGGSFENVTTSKIDYNSDAWVNRLKRKRYDAVLIFQTIHFVLNIKRFLNQVGGLVGPGGSVVIASTNHDQLFRLPYCTHFPQVLKEELKRTPDELKIVELMSEAGWMVKSRVEVEVKRKFESKAGLREWLELKPFSAFSFISQKEFEEGVNRYLDKEWRKSKSYKVDEFVLLTFTQDGK